MKRLEGDIAVLSDIDRVVQTINERHGRLNILFANAGIGEYSPLDAVTEAHFDNIFAVNVKGTFFTVQKALRIMPNGSRVVLNSSMVLFLASDESSCASGVELFVDGGIAQI